MVSRSGLDRAAGTLLETKTMDLPPWSNKQLSKIFNAYAPTNGYAVVLEFFSERRIPTNHDLGQRSLLQIPRW